MMIIVLFFFWATRSDAVCTRDLLLRELSEDIAYHGQLICRRRLPQEPGTMESPKEQNKRLNAQWDSDWSFEAAHWFPKAQALFGIETFVDSQGEPAQQDSPEEADLCELIRAALYYEKFKGYSRENLTVLKVDFLLEIACVGSSPEHQICAANANSFFNEEDWTVFLEGSGLSYNHQPSFAVQTDSEGSGEQDLLRKQDLQEAIEEKLQGNEAPLKALEPVSKAETLQIDDSIEK